MIIVSQNKDVIVNFKNITSILIDGNVLDKTNTDFEVTADGETLGYYKTEERAKEVLQEIIKSYKCIQMLKIPNFRVSVDISGKDLQQIVAYEMPKE